MSDIWHLTIADFGHSMRITMKRSCVHPSRLCAEPHGVIESEAIVPSNARAEEALGLVGQDVPERP